MKTIPWEYADINFVKAWEWKTSHFTATVRSDGERFFYLVVDSSEQVERSIASGDAITFGEAETFVKEVVGKSYPARLGYHVYTGKAGTSFRTYTGEVMDFQEFDGMQVTIEVITREDKRQTLTGVLRISGHEVLLYPDVKTKVKIPPSFIVAISKSEGGKVRSDLTQKSATTAAGMSTANSRQSVSRTVEGRYMVGCTGADGFTIGKVMHAPSSLWCPIHKV